MFFCKDLPELDCLSPLLLADAHNHPAPFWSLYLTLEDRRVVLGSVGFSGKTWSNANLLKLSENSTESKSSLYVSIICYDYILEIYLQLQAQQFSSHYSVDRHSVCKALPQGSLRTPQEIITRKTDGTNPSSSLFIL